MHASNEEEEEFPDDLVAIVYILICLSVVGGVINLFQLTRFINLQKERFLSSRRPRLIIVYCSISLSISIVCTPLLFYSEALAPASEVTEWMEYAIEFIEEMLIIVLLSIVLLRTWLLFFDYNFVTATIDQNWRGIINPNEHTFWLDSRKTWGNTRYVVIVSSIIDTFFFLGLIAVAIVIASSPLYGNALFHYFTIYGLGVPFVVIMLIILYKINQKKSINDTFYIQKEIQLLTATTIFKIIGLFVNTAFQPHTAASMHLWHLWYFCVEVIARFLLVYIQCWWVLNKLKHDNEELIDNRSMLASTLAMRYTMNDVLLYENGTGLLAFIRHCVDEMSVENILFLIEICQYKIVISERLSGRSQHLELEMFLNVFGADVSNFVSMEKQLMYTELRTFISQLNQKEQAIPRRATLYAENEEQGHSVQAMYEYALYLYNKYVNGADLIVNIGADVRGNLDNAFRFESFHNESFVNDSETEEKEKDAFREKCLYHAFDVAFEDVYELMKTDTFRRFKRTKQFHKICTHGNNSSNRLSNDSRAIR
eukprot:141702_1